MRTGQNGRVAIQWGQTEIDGLEAAPLSFLTVGAAWSWRGQARVLVEAAEQVLWRSEITHATSAVTLGHPAQIQILPEDASGLLVLTNGAQTFTATLYHVAGELTPVLVFDDGHPERDHEFWISEVSKAERKSGAVTEMDKTVVAFPQNSLSEPLDRKPRKAVSAGHRAD